MHTGIPCPDHLQHKLSKMEFRFGNRTVKTYNLYRSVYTVGTFTLLKIWVNIHNKSGADRIFFTIFTRVWTNVFSVFEPLAAMAPNPPPPQKKKKPYQNARTLAQKLVRTLQKL